MELLIILLVLFIFGVFIMKKSYDYDWLGFSLIMTSGIYLLFHVICWSISGYNYEKFETKRQSFIETLENARHNKNYFELASITREISQFNQELSSVKYDNKIFFLKDYIDDRVENMQPIK